MTRLLSHIAIVAALIAPSLANAEPSAPTGAGILTGITGVILVNRGDGYSPVKADRGVKSGDRIMARAGGKADLLYGNGCSVSVQPGKVVTVGEAPKCERYSANDKLFTAADLPEPHPAPPPPMTPPPATGGFGDPLIIGGVVVLAAGAAVGIAVSSQSSNSPASP